MPETPLQPVTERSTVELTYAPPRRTWRRRFNSTVRSWARSTFSRESYITSLKSLLWVLPLTVLIWIYAEREQVQTLTNVIVKIAPPGADSGRVVRIISATDNTVHVDIRGPQADIDQVKDYLENTLIPLDVDRTLARGEQDIDIVSQLNKLPEVEHKGVTVEHSIPSNIRVSIDPIVEREVEVKSGPDYVGTPPAFTPVRVRLRGPESEVERAARNGQLFAFANLSQFTAQLAEGGTQTLRNVPLLPPPGLDAAEVRFTPVVVEARVDRSKNETSDEISAIAVLAGMPEIPKSDQFRPRYINTVNHIHVIGPADQIKKLKSGDTTALAIFPVDLDNPDTNTARTATLHFILPDGVRVADQDKDTKITYYLEPRPKTEP